MHKHRASQQEQSHYHSCAPACARPNTTEPTTPHDARRRAGKWRHPVVPRPASLGTKQGTNHWPPSQEQSNHINPKTTMSVQWHVDGDSTWTTHGLKFRRQPLWGGGGREGQGTSNVGRCRETNAATRHPRPRFTRHPPHDRPRHDQGPSKATRRANPMANIQHQHSQRNKPPTFGRRRGQGMTMAKPKIRPA